MTQLSKSAFASLYGASGSLFPDNTSGAIGEEDVRSQGEDIKDSFLNKTDEGYTGIKGWKNSINTIANLKAIVTVGSSVPYYTAFRDTGSSDVLRLYELVSGTNAESSPDIIRPNDYATTTNEKVWKLSKVSIITLETADGSPHIAPASALVGTFSQTSIFTSTQVKSSNTTPLNVTPVPDAGYVIIPVMYFIHLDYNSVAFATNTTFRFEINGVPVSATNTSILPGTANRYTTMIPIEYDTTTNLQGHPVKFEAQTGDPTAGNSTLVVTCIYRITILNLA